MGALYSRAEQVFDVVLVFDGLRLFRVLLRLLRHVFFAEQRHGGAIVYLIGLRLHSGVEIGERRGRLGEGQKKFSLGLGPHDRRPRSLYGNRTGSHT